MQEHIDEDMIKSINHMQESTMLIRENIFDRQRVLSGILRSEQFPSDVYSRIQLMMRDVNSLISHADFSFERLDYLHDTVLGLINIEQNNIVKIFTVASVFFMPATLVASIYGMNVALPFATYPWAFWLTVILMVAFSGLTIGYFRYKKWL